MIIIIIIYYFITVPRRVSTKYFTYTLLFNYHIIANTISQQKPMLKEITWLLKVTQLYVAGPGVRSHFMLVQIQCYVFYDIVMEMAH